MMKCVLNLLSCSRILVDDDNRVCDHCHVIGLDRGASHNACNINYHIKHKEWKLLVVIHKLKGYDGHLIVRALKSEFGKVSVIPQNIEKYLSLSVGRLKFIDSYQFTSQSLDNLVNTLEDEEFKYLTDEPLRPCSPQGSVSI